MHELNMLQKDRQIIIKEGDKGAGICIANFVDYHETVRKHLQEKSATGIPYYKPISKAEVKKITKSIEQSLNDGLKKGYLTSQEHKAMSPTNKGPARMYHTFKVHKKTTDAKLPPTRPIISGSGSYTENISLYLSHHTASLVEEGKSFLKDTGHLLRILEQMNESKTLPPNAVPVSIDVRSLYQNIQHKDGIEAFTRALDKRTDKSVPTNFLVKLIDIVLKNNVFEYDEDLFIQNCGTAMGTRTAPNYANLYMNEIDERIQDEDLLARIYLFLRFIDDILIFWTGTEQELVNWLSRINAMFPTIKFTADFNFQEKTVNFLDLTITQKDGFIRTDLYRKPSDTIKYLLPTSSHPSHICKNIPLSLAIRVRRNCNEQEDTQKRMIELKDMLLRRHYRPNSINFAIEKAMQIPRKDILKEKGKRKNSRLVFNLTYNPKLPSASAIVKRHWRALTENEYMKEIYPEPPMIGFKQPDNLKKKMCRAKVPLKKTRAQRICQDKGLKPCQESRCKVCPFVNKNPNIVSSKTNAETTNSEKFTCNSASVVYCITCKNCKAQYIGQTHRRLKERIYEHLAYIRGNKQETGEHFNQKGHNISQFSVQVIEQVKDHSLHRRLLRESYWIQSFKSEINIRD